MIQKKKSIEHNGNSRQVDELLSGTLNSPYGFMNININIHDEEGTMFVWKFFNGHKIVNQRLHGCNIEHEVPTHWIAR